MNWFFSENNSKKSSLLMWQVVKQFDFRLTVRPKNFIPRYFFALLQHRRADFDRKTRSVVEIRQGLAAGSLNLPSSGLRPPSPIRWEKE
jgi:hypothetical protein